MQSDSVIRTDMQILLVVTVEREVCVRSLRRAYTGGKEAFARLMRAGFVGERDLTSECPRCTCRCEKIFTARLVPADLPLNQTAWLRDIYKKAGI